MRFLSRLQWVPALSASLVLLAACGGGGGGTNGATSPTVTYDTSFINPTITDNYASAWIGDGGGFGGDGGGSGDSAGGAGDGELVQLIGGFPAGSGSTLLTWKVLRSQYGQSGATGTLTVIRNLNSSGGYTVTAVNGAAPRATQANLMVSRSGVVTGTLPLTIAGAVKDTVFNAVRLADAKTNVVNFAPLAGQYAFGYYLADKGTGANRAVGGGWMKLKADGTGRICPDALSYSDTCTGGKDVVASYDTKNNSFIHINQASAQSIAVPAGINNTVDIVAVFRPVTINGVNGYAVTGDVLTYDTRNTSKPQETGVIYGSRTVDINGLNAVTLNSLFVVGSYSVSVNSVNAGKSGYMFASINTTSNGVKVRSSVDASTPAVCDNNLNDQGLFDATTTNGVFNIKDQGNASLVSYGIYFDADSFVVINSDSTALMLARRISTSPSASPLGVNCLPQ